MLNYVSKDVGCRDCSWIVPNCKSCTNKSECNYCSEDYILNGNKCINTKCGKGYYFSRMRCKKCQLNCEKCI